MEAEPEPPLPEIGELPEDIIDPGTVFWILNAIGWIACILLVLGTVAFFVIRVIRQKRPVKSAKDRLALPRTEAIARIHALQAQAATAENGFLALELNRALKRFLARQYNADLQSLTTEEFWNSSEKWSAKLPSELTEATVGFFQTCDSLKYQPSADSPEAKQELIDHATAIVQYEPVQAR